MYETNYSKYLKNKNNGAKEGVKEFNDTMEAKLNSLKSSAIENSDAK